MRRALEEKPLAISPVIVRDHHFIGELARKKGPSDSPRVDELYCYCHAFTFSKYAEG